MDDAMRAADPELFDLALQYFPGDAPELSPVRIARLTRDQLDLTTRALLPESYGESARAAIPRDPLQTNYEYADILGFNAANFTPYVDWVGALSERVRAAPEQVVDCGAENSAPGCLGEQARRFVRRAFRGIATDTQLDRYAGFYTDSVDQVGLAQATADLVDVTLTAPGYVFRDEVHTDAAGALLPEQRLQALTYTLADAPPEALEGPAGEPWEASVERVLMSPLSRDKLVRFFIAWLEVREPEDFTIATEVFPEFTPELAEAMVEETHRFLEHQLMAAAPRLSDVTQARESFVSDALSEIYDVDGGRDGELVALDPDERLGILTQPAVITSHSGPSTTRLVKRGVFFTRKMMCLPLGAPPEGLDTSVPESAGRTERERIETVTASPTCQGCHAYINPFGFMQESFDPIGRFRTRDEGEPVDPSITLMLLDEGPLTADTAVEAMEALTGSMRFQQCFVRQLFRFYMARDELDGDDPVLRQMLFAFARDGAQDMLAALRVLAGDRTLSHRGEKP